MKNRNVVRRKREAYLRYHLALIRHENVRAKLPFSMYRFRARPPGVDEESIRLVRVLHNRIERTMH